MKVFFLNHSTQGHSVGGHACAAAGLEYFNRTGTKFARSTGLDLASKNWP